MENKVLEHKIVKLVGEKMGEIDAGIESGEDLAKALETIGIGVIAMLNKNLNETVTTKEKQQIINGTVIATIILSLEAEEKTRVAAQVQ